MAVRGFLAWARRRLPHRLVVAAALSTAVAREASACSPPQCTIAMAHQNHPLRLQAPVANASKKRWIEDSASISPAACSDDTLHAAGDIDARMYAATSSVPPQHTTSGTSNAL